MYVVAVHKMLSLRTVGTLTAGSNSFQPPLPLAHPVRHTCVGAVSTKQVVNGVMRRLSLVGNNPNKRGMFRDQSNALLHCDYRSSALLDAMEA